MKKFGLLFAIFSLAFPGYAQPEEPIDTTAPRRHLITPEIPTPPQCPKEVPKKTRPAIKSAPNQSLPQRDFKELPSKKLTSQMYGQYTPSQGPEFYDYPEDDMYDGSTDGVPADLPLPRYRKTPNSAPFPAEFNRQPRYRTPEYYPYHTRPPSHSNFETPMQLQHRDNISIHPLPQSNPPGPKVHQFPDDFSNEPLNR